MANTITILVEHDDINYYKDKLKYFDREVVLKALGEDLAAMYIQYDNNANNVQPNMSNVSNTSDTYILGFERPNDIIEIAEEWNSELRDNAVRHLEELEALAKESEENLKILKDFMYSYVGTYVNYVNQREHLSIQYQSGKLTQEQYNKAVDNIKADKNAKYEFDVKASEIRHVMYDILGYKIYAWTEGAKKLPKTDKYVMKKLASQKRKSDSHTFGTMTEDLLVYGASREKYNEYVAKGFKYKAADMCLIKADDFNKCKNPLAIVLTKYAELNKEYTSYFKPIRETNMEGKIFKNYSLARIETRRIMNPGKVN
mgnify:FL=1